MHTPARPKLRETTPEWVGIWFPAIAPVLQRTSTRLVMGRGAVVGVPLASALRVPMRPRVLLFFARGDDAFIGDTDFLLCCWIASQDRHRPSSLHA